MIRKEIRKIAEKLQGHYDCPRNCEDCLAAARSAWRMAKKRAKS